MKTGNLEDIREVLSYDPETGVFRWKVSRGSRAAGQSTGSLTHYGYFTVRVFRKLYFSHRLAWAMFYDEWPVTEVDHINCIKTDNRIFNLRLADSFENHQNVGLQKNNSAGLKGAHYFARDDVWASQIFVRGKRIYLGRFGSAEDAHRAYATAAKEHHGAFARIK